MSDLFREKVCVFNGRCDDYDTSLNMCNTKCDDYRMNNCYRFDEQSTQAFMEAVNGKAFEKKIKEELVV